MAAFSRPMGVDEVTHPYHSIHETARRGPAGVTGPRHAPQVRAMPNVATPADFVAARRAKLAQSPWASLFRAGAWAAFAVLALIPVQAALFAAHPPPPTVLGHFESLRAQPLVGLCNLDLLYLVTMALTVPLNLALYAALRRYSPAWMLLALVFNLMSTTMFFSSGAAFEMLGLSHRYFAAGSDAERATLLAAGEAVMARYQGTAFDVSYVLGVVPAVVMSVVMLKTAVFSRATAWWGLATGVLMALPPTVGLAGMVAAFASLLPLSVWLFLCGRRLLRLAQPSRSR